MSRLQGYFMVSISVHAHEKTQDQEDKASAGLGEKLIARSLLRSLNLTLQFDLFLDFLKRDDR